jgi:SAM-dependent methyltransferase
MSSYQEPLSESLDQTFNYTGKDELQQQQYLQRYNRFIASLFAGVCKPGQSLLDFGAGIGTISSLVKEMASPGKITCIELDQENAQVLKRKGFEVLSHAELCPQGSIDVIYSSNVLEHIEDDVAILKSLHGCMKPGGRGVFWVPAFQCLWTVFDDRVGHFRRYRRDGLESVCRQAGFEVEKCLYQDSVGFFVALLFKMITDKEGSVSSTSFKIYDAVIFPISRVCDLLLSRFFGKNLLIYVRKPAASR